MTGMLIFMLMSRPQTNVDMNSIDESTEEITGFFKDPNVKKLFVILDF
jgi:hypothetical protein